MNAVARIKPKTSKSTPNTIVKQLIPKLGDLKYNGAEPDWRKGLSKEFRQESVIKAFNWYNYHYGKKEARDFVVDWLERNEKTKEAKKFRTTSDRQINVTLGWLCRMNTVGLLLTEHEQLRIDNYVRKELSNTVAPLEIIDDKSKGNSSIQDRLRAKVTECAGEIDGLFDDFIKSGAKGSADTTPVAIMRKLNIAPQMVNDIARVWKKELEEFNLVVKGRDPQLVEGYSNFTKIQMRNLIKFAESVINDCGAYVQIKKTERKPRTKKAVSPEKQASKFKYIKEFKELNLVSESPTKLIGASEAWLYDTKHRKLIHVEADVHAGSITIKNNSIIGFNPGNTVKKTLRKPLAQINMLFVNGKPGARKVFKDIKATAVKFNCRGGSGLIILKAW